MHLKRMEARLHNSQTARFKDPYRWLVSAMAFIANGKAYANLRPATRWLAALGQPLFGCSTPDGYSLLGRDWISAGQLTQRFEVARELVASRQEILETASDPVAASKSRAFTTHYSQLGPVSRKTIDLATKEDDKLALMISSPEFMYG